MKQSERDHVAAALDLLDERGPAAAGPGLTVAAMAAASGLSRSSIYRHWETVVDLNRDLTAYAITGAEGWQRRILAEAPDQPLGDALRRALAGPEPGIRARSSIRAWPLDDPVRDVTTAWERAWLQQFEIWLGHHATAQGRRSTTGDRTVALAIAGLVEGHLLLDRVWSHPGADDWFSGRPEHLPRSVERLFADLTEPGAADVGPATATAEVLPEPELPRAARRALELAAPVIAEAPFGAPEAVAPGRLVDPALLARRMGVSERHVYDLWPTATDANVAIVHAMGERAVATFEFLADQIIDVGTSGTVYERYGTLTASGYEAYIQTAVLPGRIHMFQCAHVLVDPAVLDAFIATTRRAAPSIRALFLAMLGMSRKHRRPGVTVDEYLAEMRAAVGGVQRLAALDPALLDEQVDDDSERRPMCGYVAYRILEPLVTREPPVLAPETAPPMA